LGTEKKSALSFETICTAGKLQARKSFVFSLPVYLLPKSSHPQLPISGYDMGNWGTISATQYLSYIRHLLIINSCVGNHPRGLNGRRMTVREGDLVPCALKPSAGSSGSQSHQYDDTFFGKNKHANRKNVRGAPTVFPAHIEDELKTVYHASDLFSSHQGMYY
jgi:hypothetical protein